ncbi:HNH endonuclease family protein [Amycolatopsis sp. VS8301801F10]|uniref:HNH endonuclease family protein n=1 Tax=unclassified Amycolatopsis TaxID=2618356 RepID=UPI0038FCEEAE
MARPFPTKRTVLLAVVLLIAVVGFWYGQREVGDSQSEAAPASAADATKQLSELKIGARGTMTGYSRDKFKHWDSQGDNCDTREAVLKRAGKDVKTGSDCKPTSGTWLSVYDGQTWTKPTQLDIDHMVPLGQAWVSGARDWTQEKREQFANDLTRPQLFAVTASVNRQKSDKAPDEWKPPLVSFWCTYATDWVTVKHYYGLTITDMEKNALQDMLKRCPAS